MADPFAQYSPPAAIDVAPADLGIQRYHQFLRSQQINPNTIGTALMDRNTGEMIVPTIAQEYRAINMNNEANAAHAKLLRASHMAWQNRRPADALANYGRAQDLNAKRGGDYVSRLQHFLEPILREINLPPSANGFADI